VRLVGPVPARGGESIIAEDAEFTEDAEVARKLATCVFAVLLRVLCKLRVLRD
jgi:hypothetical protein